MGEEGREAWYTKYSILTLVCILKEKSGMLKAQFQNFLLVPLKEFCYLPNNLGSHLNFLEFFVSFSKMRLLHIDNLY